MTDRENQFDARLLVSFQKVATAQQYCRAICLHRIDRAHHTPYFILSRKRLLAK